MLRLSKFFFTLSLTLLFYVSNVQADVKQETETKVQLKGPLGSVMGMFGGNKPTRQILYLKGDMQRMDTIKKGKVTDSQIIDLEREVFISIDHKKKKYTEMTFEEWQEMLESGLAGMFNQKQSDQQTDEKPGTKMDFKVNVDVQTPGDKKKIANRQTEKVVLEINLEAEGVAEDEGQEPKEFKGGMIVRSDNWMAKSVEGGEEMKAFAKKMAEKLGMAPGQGGMASIIANALKSNEQLAEAMKKFQEESEKLEGAPMYVHTTFETWGEGGAKDEEEKEKMEIPKGLGGLMKGFGKKKKDKQEDDASNILMETTMNVLKYSTEPLAGEIFSVPANYKLEERKRK